MIARPLSFIDPPKRSDGINAKEILEERGLEIVHSDQVKSLPYAQTLGQGVTGERGTAITYLPTGYALGRIRDHKVLAGHPSGRLYTRSTLFLPHLKWLYTSGRDPCECKLCSSPYTRRRSKETRDEKPLKHSSTRILVDKKPRRPRRSKTEAIYEPLRPMEKVLIKIPHENDPPTPGCISIPRLVSVPNIEKKLRPQY